MKKGDHIATPAEREELLDSYELAIKCGQVSSMRQFCAKTKNAPNYATFSRWVKERSRDGKPAKPRNVGKALSHRQVSMVLLTQTLRKKHSEMFLSRLISHNDSKELHSAIRNPLWKPM